MTEKQLLSDLKSGNRQAYRTIFMEYYKIVLAYLIKLSGDMVLSEDLAQGVFLKLWTRRNAINIHTSLKKYLYSTAYNSFMDYHRAAEREKTMHADYLYTSGLIQEEQETGHRQKLDRDICRLKKLIGELPPRCRKIFLLNKLEGKKYREIAEQLDISVKTVEAQMYIAMKKLREELKK
ncbi:RNA polymerase sigma-70 factor [Sinomicrobium soli]|uniref:RNA polymerase sigma-70 factor n=1 Tax=Sinomicrobium sp. N-1-3-6 TaxID=2219864 RepID=UPI000DCCBF7F|nr:RNA polymerase sigma-70 factor [Sinomicrobium sp. N-1-3-6]RAV27936.1 hypothetical protein DN748_16175 [Sinomicrobium sp. N-1-3-6]